MSWLFSQALVAAYLGAQSSDGEPFAPLNVTPTAHPFWHRDKTTDQSRLSRYGLTCRVLTADLGAELLTSYLAAFPARTSAQQEREQASPEPAADSGDTWHGSLARYDPATRSWRTVQRSLFEDLEMSLATFPRSGMTVAGLLWELPTSAPRISVTGSGLWQTPVADDAVDRERGKLNSRGEPKLSAQVLMWPTPVASEATAGPRKPDGKRGARLTDIVAGTFPTPTARDWRSGKASEATHAKNSRPLSEQIGGKLNPRWVEWLMNWPIGWTSLEPSAMDKYRDVWPTPGAD